MISKNITILNILENLGYSRPSLLEGVIKDKE